MADGMSAGEAGGLPSAVNTTQFHVHPEGRLVTHAADSTPGKA